MYQFIGKDDCLFVGQCREYSGIGMVAAVEEQGSFAVEAFGQQLFQFRVNCKVSGQQAGGRGGKRVFLFFPFLQKCFLKVGAGCQPQIIVGRQVKHGLTFFLDPVTVMCDGW